MSQVYSDMGVYLWATLKKYLYTIIQIGSWKVY